VNTAYEAYQVYFGDIHSHCDVGYGHGSIEDAYQNARLQLDFASVTAHALWPDLPLEDSRLQEVARYHQDGFARAAKQWSQYLETTREVNDAGSFVSFPSFEWHSLRYGDHNVYFKDDRAQIVAASDLVELRRKLTTLPQQGTATFLIPHHIGYKPGYRGIAWPDFDTSFSPVVEIFSMHGLAEGSPGPYPYLHTMGPVDGHSALDYGLQSGHVFGFIGSTDHHAAHPGSYGNGRLGVWARELTRNGIWEAIANRRTYALTGDRIVLAFSINDHPMGSAITNSVERHIEVLINAGGAIDYVDLVQNGRLIQRWTIYEREDEDLLSAPVKVLLEMGWGEKHVNVDWQGAVGISSGQLIDIEPRFRGPDILEPQAGENRPTPLVHGVVREIRGCVLKPGVGVIQPPPPLVHKGFV
jgi:hypothetical protein